MLINAILLCGGRCIHITFSIAIPRDKKCINRLSYFMMRDNSMSSFQKINFLPFLPNKLMHAFSFGKHHNKFSIVLLWKDPIYEFQRHFPII